MLHFGHRRECFFKRCVIIKAVKVQKINMVEFQLLAALIEHGGNVLRSCATLIGDFCRQVDRVPLCRD